MSYDIAKQEANYPTAEQRQQTVRERLSWKKESLERQLANVTEALALLDKSPDFEAIHNAITKAGY